MIGHSVLRQTHRLHFLSRDILTHLFQVTKDSQALNDPKVEKPGTVLSDSLAGESAKSGGDFASNTNPSVLLQGANSSTANNTDISGARTLNAAVDAEARQAQEGWSETASLNAGKGLDPSSGGDRAYNTTTSTANSNAAPSYVNANTLAGETNPHGKNLKEGGFDSDGPNASFNNDIGGKNDPGRAALSGFQKSNANVAADSGRSGEEEGKTENSFGALDNSTSS